MHSIEPPTLRAKGVLNISRFSLFTGYRVTPRDSVDAARRAGDFLDRALFFKKFGDITLVSDWRGRAGLYI